jgi:prolyl-tRNA editing enzyme YbaK/EbsC (Cys-tRNA(Pro) deacylase)
MPDKDVAREVTGYERGTITPFGALPSPAGTPWPVIADALIVSRGGPVSIGAGEHGLAASVDPSQMVGVLDARVADVTEPL